MPKIRTREEKENLQKQRAMQREIYDRLNDTEKAEYIEERKQASREKAESRKNKVTFFRNCVKKGLEYARKNHQDIRFFHGGVGFQQISAAAIRKTEADGMTSYYQIAYTFRKPTDSFSTRIARGITAYRLMDKVKHPYQFRLGLTKGGYIKTGRLRSVIESHIQMDILSARIPISGKLEREIVKEHKHVHLEEEVPLTLVGAINNLMEGKNEKTKPI